MKIMEQKLQAFGLPRLQDFLTILRHMEREGISIDNVRNFVALKKAEIQRGGERIAQWRKRWLKNALKCPDCKTLMQLARGESDDCFWTCRKCRYSEYRPHRIEEELKSIGIKPEE